MAESGVILPADSTGKALRTETNTTTFTTGSGGVVHQQVVSLGDPTTPANLATVDSNGRLVAAVAGASVATPSVASWNSATTLNTAYTVTTAGQAGNITFWFYNTVGGSPFTGTPAVAFEQSSDGTNWAPLPVLRSDTNTVTTAMVVPTMAATVSLACDAALEGVSQCRVRLTAVTGSTNAMSVIALMGGGFFEPSVALIQPVRTPVGWTSIAAAGVTVEALLSGSTTRGVTNTAAQTSITVTTGKTLHIQSISVATRLGAAAVGWSRFVLRTAASSIGAASSPLWVAEVAPPTATSGAGYSASYSFPDGLEIPSTVQVAISHISSATTNVESVSLNGYEY